ncbi:MAG TPA: putative Ig domain-containing protein [Pirellulales bacterium]|nr:putative Ig domain-containing protein [Pirellulales bacterium]
MLFTMLRTRAISSRQRRVGRRGPNPLSRRRLRVEALEVRDVLAPLTFAAGVSLPTARGDVAAVIQASNAMVLGGPTTDVPALSASDPTWAAFLGSEAPISGVVSSPGVGILPDGYVLHFGGTGHSDDNHGALSSANEYLYYSTSENGGDTAVASMNSPRALLGSATDENHNVYAIGGTDAASVPLSSAESFSQSSNTWTLIASLPQSLYSESVVADGNGHLFTFGGVGADGSITSNVYEYTIATNTWSTAASLPIAIRDSAAVLASNGRIYVLGGTTSSGATASVESYDPVGNTWTTEAPLPSAVSSAAAVNDALGRIEVLGGYDANGNAVASVWISQKLNQADAAPSITTSPPLYAWTGKPYSYQVYSTANPQATYSLTAAPAGMTLNTVTGLIQWTPTASQAGNATVTVEASNFAGTNSQTYTIDVKPSPPTTPANVAFTAATTSSLTLSWDASTDPAGVTGYTIYHWYETGHSGRGGGITIHQDPVLTVTGTTGTVSGLASGATYSYDVRAFDAAGLYSGYSIVVSHETYVLPSFTGFAAGSTFNLTAKHAFSTTLTATGYPTDFSYSIVNPPTGMTVDAASGTVSWTPPDSYVGTTDVTFQVTSSAGSGTIDYNFSVAPNLPVVQYTSANLVNGTLFAAPTAQLSMQLVDVSSGATDTWSLVSGPSGMAVNATTGVVTWTPPKGTALGTVNATFQGTNYAGSGTLAVAIDVVFTNAPTKVRASRLTYTSSGDTALITWAAPTANATQIAKFEVLVTQPGGTGVFTTTYTLAKAKRSLSLAGLDVSSLITVEVVALDANGDLGMPAIISFASPY